jgi:pilus assembly protein Flp/PilA
MLSFLVGMRTRFYSVLHREEGQALAEYALILALIAVVAVATLTILGEDVTKILKEIGEKL